MGTRINVVMDHNILDYRDQSTVSARLDATLPAALAVRDYWDTASAAHPSEKDDQVGPYAAKIRTGGQWRGFLSIPLLRQVHLQACRRIAEALGATRTAFFPDKEETDRTIPWVWYSENIMRRRTR